MQAALVSGGGSWQGWVSGWGEGVGWGEGAVNTGLMTCVPDALEVGTAASWYTCLPIRLHVCYTYPWFTAVSSFTQPPQPSQHQGSVAAKHTTVRMTLRSMAHTTQHTAQKGTASVFVCDHPTKIMQVPQTWALKSSPPDMHQHTLSPCTPEPNMHPRAHPTITRALPPHHRPYPGTPARTPLPTFPI